MDFFGGACTTTQRGDSRLRFPLGPLTPAGKREEKTKENQGKSLKTGGKWRKMEEGQEKGRKKTTEHEGKSSKAGGKRRNSEAQRRAASVGVRNKIVCKGMRSDTEEGGAKGCKARKSLPKVLQMVWASSRRLTSGLRIIEVGGGQCKV